MEYPLNDKVKTRIKIPHGGNISNPKSLNYKKESTILDFSSNISPMGPSKQVLQSIQKNIDKITKYPDPDSVGLRQKLQRYCGISKSHITVGNGAVEIIYNFCKAFISNKTPVLIPIPTFGEYEAAARLNSNRISFFKTMDVNEDLDNLITKIPSRGCVFLCNPNNPTGALVSKENMIKIINCARDKFTLVFIDECFMELVPKRDESVISKVKNYKNLFVLRSLTKSFALAGIRVGYGIGSQNMALVLNKLNMPWNVNILAQYAGVAALDHAETNLDKTNKTIEREAKYLKGCISNLPGFSYYDSSTNFILVKTKKDSRLIQKKLLKKKILIRDCSTIKGLDNHHIRIAVRTRKDNQQLVKELARLN